MEFLIELQERWNIDLLIVALVLLSGFFQEKYLCKVVLSKDSRYDQALKTLLVSFLVSVVYVYLQYRSDERQWAKYFVSYFFATSLYELLVKPFAKWINQLGGKSE